MKTFSPFRFRTLPVFLCLLFLAGCGGPRYYADVTLLRAPSAPKAHTAVIEPADGMDGNDLVYSRAADRLAGILKADGRAVTSSPGTADETVRLGFSHRGPFAITRETIRPDFIPVERRGRIRHEIIYVRETETQLWYFTDLLISGTPHAVGKDRTKEGSQSWRIEAEVHSRNASPVDRLDAALTAVAGVISDPQDSRRSFVITAKDGEEPEVREMTD